LSVLLLATVNAFHLVTQVDTIIILFL